jgi:hypothetical protein
MKYLTFINTGEVDTKAMTLIGASTKRDDAKLIGFFGSGFKYALAALLRIGATPIIYSGTRKIEITTREETFRDKTFNVICIDGKETSMTVESGPDWSAVDAIREIYSNAIDEGLVNKVMYDEEPTGVQGVTVVSIPINCNEIQFVIDNWEDYFFDTKGKEPIVSTDYVDLYINEQKLARMLPDETSRRFPVYRAGIVCEKSTADKAFFSYNFVPERVPDSVVHKLSEARTLEYSYAARTTMCEALWRLNDYEVCKEFLIFIANNDDAAEGMILLHDLDNNTPSSAWRSVVRDTKITSHEALAQEEREAAEGELIISNRLYKFFASEGLLSGKFFSARAGAFKMKEPTHAQKETLIRACMFCAKNYGITIDPDTVSVAKMDSQYMAITFNGVIIINTLYLDKGYKDTVKCLIEEWLHITTDAKDEDYSMHHAYLNLLLSIGNEMEAKGVELYAN